MKRKTLFLCRAAAIAALYVVLTYLSALLGLSSGVPQCRLAEALTVLPAFTTAAIPGLTVGCLVSNLIFSGNVFDIIFGTLATAVGAVGSYLVRRVTVKNVPIMAPVPPIVANTLVIPFILRFALGTEQTLPLLFLTVGVGELTSAGVLGTLLSFAVTPYSKYIFGKDNKK